LVAEAARLVTVITKTHKNSILRADRALERGTTAAAAGDGGGGDGGGDGDGVITVAALAGKMVRQGPRLEHTNNSFGQNSHTNRTNVLENEGKKLRKYMEMKRI
jgi:hypothetical protein